MPHMAHPLPKVRLHQRGPVPLVPVLPKLIHGVFHIILILRELEKLQENAFARPLGPHQKREVAEIDGDIRKLAEVCHSAH